MKLPSNIGELFSAALDIEKAKKLLLPLIFLSMSVHLLIFRFLCVRASILNRLIPVS